jgi:predicted amidohydrolase
MALVTQFPAFIISHAAPVFTTAATVISFFALTSTPAVIPLVALQTTLLLSAWTFVRRQNGYMKAALQALSIAIASGAAHLAPSMQALSTPNVALAVLSCIALVTSTIAVLVVLASALLRRSVHNNWAQFTLFPTLWASVWGCMSRVSPVGQLVAWSPVLGLGPYEWTRQVVGQWGIDWITAAWAVVVAEVLGDWLVGASDDEDSLLSAEPRLIDYDNGHAHNSIAHPTNTSSNTHRRLSRSNAILCLSTLLVLLMAPAYFLPYLPAPLNSDETTPYSVGCAFPDPRAVKDGNPNINDYVRSTRQLQNEANIIIWPESAVRFDTPDARTKAFTEIQNTTSAGKYIGISFEEYVPRDGKHRNGFALIESGKIGPPVFEYYKRNLVPSKNTPLIARNILLTVLNLVAESFSLTPGHEAPGIFTIELKKPFKGRTVPVSASICLDFAFSSSFTSLSSRPALILAPAKTWHIGVGLAMWEQAKARAAETGSTVVWCDGGKGGISGVANGAYSEIVQVGPGSWVKHIAIPHPFNERRTFFTWGGDGVAFLIVWIVTFGPIPLVHAALQTIRYGRGGIANVMPVLQAALPGRRKRTIGPSVDEQTSLLG